MKWLTGLVVLLALTGAPNAAAAVPLAPVSAPALGTVTEHPAVLVPAGGGCSSGWLDPARAECSSRSAS